MKKVMNKVRNNTHKKLGDFQSTPKPVSPNGRSQNRKTSIPTKEMARWEDDGGAVRTTRTHELKSPSR